ncbi:hypothetical protein EVAR_39129_1 [Eumeta japonica]|uniref:Zinc finger BED domain-containing protein 4 n=1 Tax=Eumeta variegata TaxID=151549 RepID=A0A4C2A9I8_EUMVA|nr:hypothetical protein EVAR_39129_1 [Eumeta japonica]
MVDWDLVFIATLAEEEDLINQRRFWQSSYPECCLGAGSTEGCRSIPKHSQGCRHSSLKHTEAESVAKVQKLTTRNDKRMGPIEHVAALVIATILDPRSKKMYFNDAIACSNAVSKIKDLMRIIICITM